MELGPLVRQEDRDYRFFAGVYYIKVATKKMKCCINIAHAIKHCRHKACTGTSTTCLIDDPRWDGYEVPPTSNANYGWILNIVSKLSQNGVAGFLLANGAPVSYTHLDVYKRQMERSSFSLRAVISSSMQSRESASHAADFTSS